MEQQILDVFYQNILPQASSEEMVCIDGFLFDASFCLSSQKENNYREDMPIIQIHNQKRFEDALVRYTESMISFLQEHSQLHKLDYVYFEGKLDSMIASTVLSVWFNATEEDFRNPEEFLERRRRFLADSISQKEYLHYMVGEVIEDKIPHHFESVVDIWNPSGNETPYVFRSKMCGEDDSELLLPNIGFGIDGEKAYVYVIHHGRFKEGLSAEEKKLNRLLYQANQNVCDDYFCENIKDVSVSSIVALTLFSAFLQKVGCKEMVVKGNFPIRNIAKLHNSKIPFSEFSRICNNTINKYYRSFRRLSYHFPELEITSYPYEIDNSMHLQVPDAFSVYPNDYIHEVYRSGKGNQNFKIK